MQKLWLMLVFISLVVSNAPVGAQSGTVATNNCISVVGDSIPYGSVVFMLPGQGFAVIRTKPLAVVLQEELAAQGMGHIEVRDRSVAAANLSPLGKTPYQDDPTYVELLRDNCRFIVMPGWNNELNVYGPAEAELYVDNLHDFARLWHNINPHTQILMLSHYWGQPQEFVEGYGVGVTLENYTAHLEAFRAACEPEGRLALLAGIWCMDVPPLFEGISPADYVVLARTRQQLNVMLYEPIPAEFVPLLEVYFREHPNDPIYGDGVHFSAAGKLIYAQAIIRRLLEIEPEL